MSSQGYSKITENCFDWTGFEQRKGLKLCSTCGPYKYRDGRYLFRKDAMSYIFLPMNMFKTNDNGNLEHIETTSDQVMQYRLEPKKAFELNPNVIKVEGEYPLIKVTFVDNQVTNYSFNLTEYNLEQNHAQNQH